MTIIGSPPKDDDTRLQAELARLRERIAVFEAAHPRWAVNWQHPQ